MINTKIKHQLDTHLPYGMITTKQWLSAKGMALHSIDNALKSKKLVMLTTGVYARVGVPITWEGIVCSLQRMNQELVTVGGLSVLELLGFGHYVVNDYVRDGYVSDKKAKTIQLYAQTKLPVWLNKLTSSVTFEWHGTKTLWSSEFLAEEKYVIEHTWREDLPAIKLSCPEKAYLEMLMSVPKNISFEHADELMQGMTSLSPRKLETLLKACKHVKVKRLFFWLAQRQGYAWFKKLDYKNFDLGVGKRVIASDGKLDKTYQITVPEHLHESN